MRLTGPWIVLPLFSFFGCAGQPGPAVFKSDPQRPHWEEQMDLAKRYAAAGMNYVLKVTPQQAEEKEIEGGVYVFYNNPNPFCYTYTIPGTWFAAEEPNAYRSKDGAFVGVQFLLASEFRSGGGATVIERAGNQITRQYERGLGQRLKDVELIPFESAQYESWLWRAAPATQAGRLVVFPAKIIVNIRRDAIVQITVQGTDDDHGLARRIIEGLRTTADPECYWVPWRTV
jgi:hypothetical protein